MASVMPCSSGCERKAALAHTHSRLDSWAMVSWASQGGSAGCATGAAAAAAASSRCCRSTRTLTAASRLSLPSSLPSRVRSSSALEAWAGATAGSRRTSWSASSSGSVCGGRRPSPLQQASTLTSERMCSLAAPCCSTRNRRGSDGCAATAARSLPAPPPAWPSLFSWYSAAAAAAGGMSSSVPPSSSANTPSMLRCRRIAASNSDCCTLLAVAPCWCRRRCRPCVRGWPACCDVSCAAAAR